MSLGRPLRLALLLGLAALAGATLASPAEAQQLSTRASSRNVEVGDSFTLQLVALVDQGEPLPRKPMLRAPPGITVHGPSVATQQQISLQGGSFSQRVGISATWTLEASRAGSYRIGPASVEVGGRIVSGDVVEVQVSPPGTRPRPKPFDPFDPFGFGIPSLPNLPFGSPAEPGEEPELPPFPEELRVGRAEDSMAFLRAVATPMHAVVGEQITFKVFAYGARGPFRETNTSEPSREAFLAQTLLENSYTETTYRVPIGGNVWSAKKVRELALFPIRAGKLTIGAMRMGFEGRGYPSAGQHRGLERYSAPLFVEVAEPPLDGRPPGYKLGDVGRFSLSAKVEPREVTAGEAVSVVAKLEGTGMLPYSLKTPQQHGVRWLEPTQVEEIEPRGSTIGGWRKLTYVVHMDEAGEVDLGELSLPYWDPERESYDVAKVTLGKVRVKPSSDSAPKLAEEPDALKGVMTLRKTLGPGASPPKPLADAPWFWWALLLAPTTVVMGGGAMTLSRRVKERVREARDSSRSAAQRALAEAEQAASGADVTKAASAAERAVLFAVEDATGVKARGVLRGELETALAQAGVPGELAREVRALFDDLDDVRFTGAAKAGSGAEELSRRAAALVRDLGRQRAPSTSRG